MFFDSVGNLYIKNNSDTYQINIDGKSCLEWTKTKCEIYDKIKCEIINSNDKYYNITLENVINNVTIDGNSEGDYLDYLTKGNCEYVNNDDEDDECFTFYSNIDVINNDILVYNTDETVCALYETIIYRNNKILFRTKNNQLPLYRLFINLDNNICYLKPTGSPAKQFTLEITSFLDNKNDN